MNPNVVAGLINRNYKNFDMFSFDNRLKLQKFVYIMEYMFGLNLGYEFNWYHYGPYCVQLAKDGFGVSFEQTPELKFEDVTSEVQFENFLTFIKNKDSNWMEIIASVHFLNKLGYSKEDVIKRIKEKREQLKNEEKTISQLYEELKFKGMLNG